MDETTRQLLIRLKDQGVQPIYGGGEYPSGYVVNKTNTNAKSYADVMALQNIKREVYIEFQQQNILPTPQLSVPVAAPPTYSSTFPLDKGFWLIPGHDKPFKICT